VKWRPSDRYPTTLSIRNRDGNRFEGDMTVDMKPVIRYKHEATHYFRGVVVGKHVAFVPYRIEGACGAAVYQLRVNRAKQWNGTWFIGSGSGPLSGKMWLQPSLSEHEAESLAGAGRRTERG
jgi:hypothetical protein